MRGRDEEGGRKEGKEEREGDRKRKKEEREKAEE